VIIEKELNYLHMAYIQQLAIISNFSFYHNDLNDFLTWHTLKP